MLHHSSTAPVLTVSIVLYHSARELLAATCSSLRLAVQRAQAEGLLGACQLVLVDHSGCADYRGGIEEVLQRELGDGLLPYELHRADDNLGYGHGHNRAPVSPAGFRLILNPDVEVAEDALVEGLGYLARQPAVALVSPRVSAADGSQEYLCKRYPSVWVLLLRAFGPEFLRRRFRRSMEHYEARDLCSADTPATVPLASGCFMLVRGAALAAVGGFDERYFLYFEDFDLSLRLAKHGEVRFLPSMGIVHHGGYAARKGWRHVGMFMRSCVRFFRDHGWRWI